MALQNPDLNDQGYLRQNTDQSLARPSRRLEQPWRGLHQRFGKLEAALIAATKPALPAGTDIQLQLLNLKNDMKMLFDSNTTAEREEAMLSELRAKVKEKDEVGMYLLGADKWPEHYLASRGQGTCAMSYTTKAAAILSSLQSEAVHLIPGKQPELIGLRQWLRIAGE